MSVRLVRENGSKENEKIADKVTHKTLYCLSFVPTIRKFRVKIVELAVITYHVNLLTVNSNLLTSSAHMPTSFWILERSSTVCSFESTPSLLV